MSESTNLKSADCVKSATLEGEPSKDLYASLDREEIRMKRRQRRKEKMLIRRKVQQLTKNVKLRVITERHLDVLKWRAARCVQAEKTQTLDMGKLMISGVRATTCPAEVVVFPSRPKQEPELNKGKKREEPKKPKTRLKKELIQFRKEKKEKECTVVDCDNSKPEEDSKEGSPEETSKCLEKVEQPTIVHSRKFRSYCDNTTSKKICQLTENLLRKLNIFQRRAHEKNMVRARLHRRYVVGYKQVRRQIELKKAKLVIIAPDLEAADFPGGLDEIVNSLKSKCKEQEIPYLFSLRRRSLAYALSIKVPVSCVAILSYDGVHEIFNQLTAALEIERNSYAAHKIV